MFINRQMEVRIHPKQAALRTISFSTMELNILVKSVSYILLLLF